MTATDSTKQKIHHGRNIKRFREMFGMKQEALAIELGEDWSQKRISRLEEQEVIDDAILNEISAVLKVPVEAIKSFDEQAAVVYFNTFNDSSFTSSNGAFSPYQCTFNAVETVLKLVDENKKLYEQLLASEREKVQLLQRMLDQK